MFRPRGINSRLPAIIVLHGWMGAGIRAAGIVAPLAETFSEQGYVTLALSMRGWPETGGKDDCGLKQPDDIARAVAWLASQPGVNPARIGIVGLSQGGQVALLTGVRSRRVKAIVAYYPATDIAALERTTMDSGLTIYIDDHCKPQTDRRSPVHFADEISAAVLLISGDWDRRTPPSQSKEMYDAMKKDGGTAKLYLESHAGHGFAPDQYQRSWRETLEFLAAHLGR